MVIPVRTLLMWIGRTEDSKSRNTQRCRDMHWTRIVAYNKRTPMNNRAELGKRGFWNNLCRYLHPLLDKASIILFPRPPEHNNRSTIALTDEIPETSIMFKPPSFGIPSAARVQSNNLFAVKVFSAEPFRRKLFRPAFKRKIWLEMKHRNVKPA